MCTFLFAFAIILFPQFSTSQKFFSFGANEYYVEKNNPVESYSEAEGRCNASNAILAVVNTKNISNFLAEKIGNLSSRK